MAPRLQCARSLRKEDSQEQGNAGVGTEGRRDRSQRQRTVGFWDLFVIWGGFSIIMTNLLLGALGVGVGIGPAIIAHMIGILIVAGVVWLGTILGSEQGIAGTVAMRSAFGINGRYIASVVMFIVGVGWFGVQTGMVGSAAYEIVKDLLPAIAFTPLGFGW